MSFSWLTFYYLTDEEYKQALEERKNKQKKLTATLQ